MNVRSQNLVLPPAHLIRIGMASGVIFLVLLGIWLTLAPLSGAIIVNGQVKSSGERKVVSHSQGGIVQRVHIHDGDNVVTGAPLVTLSDVRVHANLDAAHVARDALTARIARLRSERDTLTFIKFPSSFASRRLVGGIEDLAQKEIFLFNQRRSALAEQSALLRDQLRAVDAEIVGLEQLVKTSAQSMALMAKEVHVNEALLGTGYISELRVVQLQRQAKDYQLKYEGQLVDVSRAKQRRLEIDLRLRSLENDFVSRAADELREASNQLLKLQEDSRSFEDDAVRQVVTAPAAGTIVGLRVHTEGMAIGAREPILDIIPLEEDRIIEARIRPEDIVEARKALAVEVRMAGYKVRDLPLIKGLIKYVGADRQVDPITNEHYYVVRIAVDSEALSVARAASEIPLLVEPGMSAELVIQTAPRTVVEYMLDPITSGLRRALREP